jgi:uncharacterized membrane protein
LESTKRGFKKMRLPSWRKMTWVLVGWCVFVIALAVVADISFHESTPHHCSHGCHRLGGLLGTSEAIYTLILGAFWFMVLGVLWLMTGWWGRRKRGN